VAQLIAYLAILRVKMHEGLGLAALLSPLLRILAASIPAAAVGMAVCRSGNWARGPASLRNWLVLAVAGLSASAIYVALAWLLNVRKGTGR
jgi:hypothetical protein